MFDHTANFAASNILSIKMRIFSITQIWTRYIRFFIQHYVFVKYTKSLSNIDTATALQIDSTPIVVQWWYDWDWISSSATLFSNQMLQWTFISSPSFLFMTTTQKRDYNDEKRCKMHVFLSTDFILFFLCNQHTSLAVVVRNKG